MTTFMFDAYGTLFDVHSAIARHAEDAGAEASRFSEIWRAKQLEYTWTLTLAGQYLDFWTLTEQALDYAFSRVPAVDRALKPKLLDAYFYLDAFADARELLQELKSGGQQTAILSNGSPCMLMGAVEAAALTPLIDAVLSVDSIRMYKPRPEVYRLAIDRLGCGLDGIVFVSANRWDVMGAARFGFRAIWVNRANLPDEYLDAPPAEVVRDLAGIAQLVARRL